VGALPEHPVGATGSGQLRHYKPVSDDSISQQVYLRQVGAGSDDAEDVDLDRVNKRLGHEPSRRYQNRHPPWKGNGR